jgi:ribonucleoside-diphosphate reductase beta chain
MSVFNLNATNHTTAKMFFDEGGQVGVARYDTVKYPEIKRLAKQQRGFYWAPEEVDVNGDRNDFQKLTPSEQHIFTSNLKRQILLDSVQGRAPAEMLNPITALPELENFATTWTFFETIHSESYTHIIQNVYPDPGAVFDAMTDIPEIMDCAADIARYYDDFADAMYLYKALGFGTHTVNGKKISITPYELKKKLWLMLMSINVLEGVRFYVSFACSWAFAETKRMEGNAKIIKLIARDENLHLSATTKLLKSILRKDDPDFEKIAIETQEESIEIYLSAIRQEKVWAGYLMKFGTLIGLNEQLLSDFVDFRGALCMRAVGLPVPFKAPGSNPLPWTNSWIASKSVQVAPQETEITSYVIGGVKQDAISSSFKGRSL